jgi:ABC-2 type transport system permease protein
MNNIKQIALKELLAFFSSLTAFIFFGIFLAITLFIFFWVDTFFARNIADVRPMFEWMPVLLIFLVPALTMRMWSEERRSGTVELLLTAPVSNLELVLGKFLACMGLILIVLTLTIPIPITVALLAGPLDWGPVIGGYLAALFLAASYTAIGLNISARTDNQIVSLLLSVLVCGVFLLIGSDGLTSLFNNNVSDLLKLLGSGSRFQSITRGVIDFRDLYYYLSIAGVFLALNVLELEKLRWSGNRSNSRHKIWLAITYLCIANFVAANFWLQQITWARVDLTQGQNYSISAATRKYLASLKEPLIIRGYFSKKSHPLLQSLIPRLRDLLKEYAIAGNGKVHVEFVDPLEKPELEKEAQEKYNIKPGVFQSASKYQSALTNSYFDILIKYGDQFEKLGWQDLIEVKARSEKDISIALKNPEYDITSAIKKVLYSYQNSDNIFLSIEEPVKFIAYISPADKLPAPFLKLKGILDPTLDKLREKSNGKFTIEFKDPDTNNDKLGKKLEADYGLHPRVYGLFNSQKFWFSLMLQNSNRSIEVQLPREITETALESNINAGLKRFSVGLLKTIGLYSPPKGGRPKLPGQEPLRTLYEGLSNTYNVENTPLDSGFVPANIDMLILASPDNLSSKQVFAVDQFLMKGGTVLIATSPFEVDISNSLNCKEGKTGLEGWLDSYGINIPELMVLDTQNFPIPIPTHRVIGGLPVQEVQMLPYPYLVDIRPDSNNSDSEIIAGLSEIVVPWVSPIMVDKDKNKQRHIMELLKSSPESWTSSGTSVEPNYSAIQPSGFPVGKEKGRRVLAIIAEGQFESYFKGKSSPLNDTKTASNPTGNTTNDKTMSVSTINKSPESARIILFASNSFLSDQLMWMASQSLGSRYVQPVELIQNAVDWSLEDRELLSIRGRGQFGRTLRPMTEGYELFFEYLNYALAILGLVLVWFVRKRYLERAKMRFKPLIQSLSNPLAEVKS